MANQCGAGVLHRGRAPETTAPHRRALQTFCYDKALIFLDPAGYRPSFPQKPTDSVDQVVAAASSAKRQKFWQEPGGPDDNDTIVEPLNPNDSNEGFHTATAAREKTPHAVLKPYRFVGPLFDFVAGFP